MIVPTNGESPEDNVGKVPEKLPGAGDMELPPEEELKELLKKTPDDLNLDDDQDLQED